MHPVLFHIGQVLIPSYGAIAALGVLLALVLAQRTARVVHVEPNHVWNLCVIVLCAAMVGARLLLVAVNWRDLMAHPMWMLGLAMIHNPWVASVGIVVGLTAGVIYARWQRMPLADTADALAGPVALGAGLEQFGALLAGAGFGVPSRMPWAVTYTQPLAARWSGSPLGIAVHPVQAYAALAFLTLSLLLLVGLPARRQSGDVAGVGLVGMGVTLFVTEIWRDWSGRGKLAGGVLDVPQLLGVVLVLCGAWLLRERATGGTPPSGDMEVSHG